MKTLINIYHKLESVAMSAVILAFTLVLAMLPGYLIVSVSHFKFNPADWGSFSLSLFWIITLVVAIPTATKIYRDYYITANSLDEHY